MPDLSVEEARPEHPFETKWTLAQLRYKGTIRTFARNFKSQLPSMDIEDIEQELLVELWKCVLKYDPDKGASFNTLFQGCARNRCISLVRTATTKSRTGIVNSLSDEAVERAVDEAFDRLGLPSTEDTVMYRLELQEYVSKNGPGALLDKPKAGRKPLRVAS